MSTYSRTGDNNLHYNKKKISIGKKLSGMIIMLMLLVAVSVTAHAATLNAKITGASKPGTLTKGQSFSVTGMVTSTTNLKQVRLSIYNTSTKKYPYKYTINASGKQCNVAAADSYLLFDQLAAGTYNYKIVAVGTNGASKIVLKKQFTVKGDGNISITGAKPAVNITHQKGNSYSIKGKITSTYALKKITATLTNNTTSKVVYKGVVKPNTTTYSLANSALDAAMKFNQLAVGKYTIKIVAKDVQGNSKTLMNHTVNVKQQSNTSTTSTGSAAATTSTLITASGTASTPKGYVKRTTRPAASNKYYYNKNWNTYYAYNSLAPTGKKDGSGRYVTGNCTWYAVGRAMEITAQMGGNVTKVKWALGAGDPVGIFKSAKKNGLKTGTTPKVGSLVIFNYGSDGNAHIAVVEAIQNGVVYVSESGFAYGTKPNAKRTNIVFKYQNINNWAGGRKVLGYIYLV